MQKLILLAVAAVATAQIIPGEWLVVFKPSLAKSLRDRHMSKVRSLVNESNIMNEWVINNSPFAAYHIAADDETVAQISALPEVDFVEPNMMVHAYQSNCAGATADAWGIRRVTQRALPNNQQMYGAESTGRSTPIYIIDTGILITHQAFGGRARFGANFVNDGNERDGNGHGTHCAGTAAGTPYGLAREAPLWAVKVLSASGSGSTAGVVSGVQWASNHAIANSQGGVLSLSLGGGANAAMDNAVNAAFAAGNVVSVASGNSNGNACNFSPARARDVISVNSCTSTDARSTFSNFGTCTHIFAPGTSIKSAWHTSNTASNTISGTSMACPHVAGAAAKLWDDQPTLTAAEVKAEIYRWSTPNRITNPGAGSPNRLLYYTCPHDDPINA